MRRLGAGLAVALLAGCSGAVAPQLRWERNLARDARGRIVRLVLNVQDIVLHYDDQDRVASRIQRVMLGRGTAPCPVVFQLPGPEQRLSCALPAEQAPYYVENLDRYRYDRSGRPIERRRQAWLLTDLFATDAPGSLGGRIRLHDSTVTWTWNGDDPQAALIDGRVLPANDLDTQVLRNEAFQILWLGRRHGTAYLPPDRD